MAASYATAADLVATWRPLSDEETTAADKLCADASILLRREYSDLDERIAEDENVGDLARMAVEQMVLRFMRNPDAYGQESIVNWAASHGANSTGVLEVTEAERELLRPEPSTAVKPKGLKVRVPRWWAP